MEREESTAAIEIKQHDIPLPYSCPQTTAVYTKSEIGDYIRRKLEERKRKNDQKENFS